MLTIQNNWVQHWQTNRLELGTVSEFPLGVFLGWQWVAPGLHYGRLHNLGSHNVKLHNKGWEYKIWEKTKLKNCYRAQAGKQHQLSFLVKRFVFSTKICFFKKICQIFHQKHFFRISIFSLKFVQFCWKVSYLIFILKWPLKNLSNLALILKTRIWECLIEIWMALLVLQVNIGGAVV